MVQTRSQAKTTTRTTTTKTKADTTKSLPKKKATAPSSKVPSAGNDSEVPPLSTLTAKAAKEISTMESSKATKIKKGLERDGTQSYNVVPALVTKSEPLKSSLKEAPRRGRKKAADRKIEENKEIETVPTLQERAEADMVGKGGDDSDGVHKMINKNSAGRRKGIKKAEDMGLKSKAVATGTSQRRTEKKDVPVMMTSGGITASTIGRGRRAAKIQCNTDTGVGKLGGRRNTSLTSADVSKTKRRGNLQEKQAQAYVQLHEGKDTNIPEKSQRAVKQMVQEKTLAKATPVASKKQKFALSTVENTKSTTKFASEQVNASSGKAVSIDSTAPITSRLERKKHQGTQKPKSSVLCSTSRQNPLVQSAGESRLKKPPRSPIKMLMAITPAKRSKDEFMEDEDDVDDKENGLGNHIEKEWENMRNIELSNIKRSPAKSTTMQGRPEKYSLNENNMGKNSIEESGDETEPETKEEEISKIANSTSPTSSGDADIMATSTEDAAASPTAPTVNPAPTPLTFKPSSLRFLNSLTPMFPADDTTKSVSELHHNNSTKKEKHTSGNFRDSSRNASSLATAPQAFKSNKSLEPPSKLIGVAASLSLTPFGASTQPLTPFRPASSAAKAATCAGANISVRMNTFDATSASARKPMGGNHTASTSIPTSPFKSIMRVPQSSNVMSRPSSIASALSANVPKSDEFLPILTLTSPPSSEHIGLSINSVAPSTPRVRSSCRPGTGMGEKKTAQVTKADAAAHLTLSKSSHAVPMTEPSVPQPILKSALKMPASSKISRTVAVSKVKKLTFLGENKRTMISEGEGTIIGEARDARVESIAGNEMEMTPVRCNISPAKTVTFESPHPLPETPTTTKRRRQPMAPTVVEVYEHLEEMDTAEELFDREGAEEGARESLAGSISGQILSGAVFYVDVNSADGADAADIFIPLLTEMGAICVPGWLNSLDGITHVLFKDGQRKTLEKVAASGGKIKCVNIGWPLEYVTQPLMWL